MCNVHIDMHMYTLYICKCIIYVLRSCYHFYFDYVVLMWGQNTKYYFTLNCLGKKKNEYTSGGRLDIWCGREKRKEKKTV